MAAPVASALILIAAIGFSWWRYAENADNLHSVWAILSHGDVPSDLQVYLLGGQKVAHGQPLYSGDLLPGLPFTYPPFAGVVFSWFGEATHELGVAWTVASITALSLICWWGTRSLVPAVLLTAFFVLATEPVHATLYFGQINIFLMLLVCLDFLPRYRLPGIGVGLAAGMKLTPAYFILLLALQRRWGAVFIAGLTFLCTVATGFNSVTDASRFWTESMFNSDRVGYADNPGAQAMRQVLSRELGIESTPLWLLLTVLVTLLAAAGAHFALSRSELPLAVSLIGMASCLVSPFSWHHHWVWIVLFGCVIYRWWGPLMLIVFMLPYAADNVSHELFVVPNLLFTVVPIGFMGWYVWREVRFPHVISQAHTSSRRDRGDRNRPHPRPPASRQR
ncbi:glycosyltransferase 87 family protein [Corynebacterium sp. Q4381]|uniref:glycosyltransferase 87 family protein n=1 Tax=Corynebacterium sp. Marseille-Q4381 TaxID=3121597 RepID=UPI002FE5A4CF